MHRESQLRELGKVFADLSTDYVLRGTDKLHIQDQKDLRIVVGQPRQYLHHRQSLSQSKASLGGTIFGQLLYLRLPLMCTDGILAFLCTPLSFEWQMCQTLEQETFLKCGHALDYVSEYRL